MSSSHLHAVTAHAQAYGFVYPSSEIYGGLQGVYDYGPYGVMLKRNVQDFWWRSMTQLHENIVGLDAAILMAPRTWEASGHVGGFHDWMVDNRDSKKRYRVDALLEERAAMLREGGEDEASETLLRGMAQAMRAKDGERLGQLLVDEGIVCPLSKTSNWTAVHPFHLMCSTDLGAIADRSSRVYLRPETAQGIFVNFLNVQKRTRQQVPFGIAQMGKAFRNEIILRQFIFRMREFEQLEMQFFIPPDEEEKWFAYWLEQRTAWYVALGIPRDKIQLKRHEELAHYATAATDIRYQFPFGWQEVEGIHSRTDFDLRNHERVTKKRMSYFDAKLNRSYIPFVIETSAGCDRLMLMLLAQGLREEKRRTYLQLPPALAPFQAAIFPLVGKEPLVKCAQDVCEKLKYDFSIFYEKSGSIGKRYARQDLIGTPYCVTIDYDTLEDATVTIRHRDSMEQERVDIVALSDYLHKRASLQSILRSFSRRG